MKVCRHGHEVVGANVYRAPGGREQCRTCRAETRARRVPELRTSMRRAPLDDAAERRLRAAWTDAEVTRASLAERFRLGPADFTRLKLEWGERPCPGQSSCSAITASMRARRA